MFNIVFGILILTSVIDISEIMQLFGEAAVTHIHSWLYIVRDINICFFFFFVFVVAVIFFFLVLLYRTTCKI